MNELISQMNVVLADAFTFYLKAHNYHWNVEGSNFPSYHKFLGDLYEEVHSSVDDIAEKIRTLDAYAPGSLESFKQLATTNQATTLKPLAMMRDLAEDNKRLLYSLTRAYDLAEYQKELGVSNFLQDRIEAHKKHGWMLNSISKNTMNENVDMNEELSRNGKTKQQEMCKGASIIKDIYRNKRMKKEELVDRDKMDKSYDPKNDTSAKVTLKGGKTMTGQERDIIEVNPKTQPAVDGQKDTKDKKVTKA